MELVTLLLRSVLSLAKIRTSLAIAIVLVAGTTPCSSQSLKISAWEDDMRGAIGFLHVAFPDIDPKSKLVIVSNGDWGHTSGGFEIHVCEPDFSSRSAKVDDYFSENDIQCSVRTLSADFLMTLPQFGTVPSHVYIIRPAIDKRWRELASLLASHPKWTELQVSDAMKASGAKYGPRNDIAVRTLIYSLLPKLEPYFGKLTVDSIVYSTYDVTNDVPPRPPSWLVEVHPSGQEELDSAFGWTFSLNVFDGNVESIWISPISTSSKSAKPKR
jgi:hypothetical protein